jgi:uncharacterized protein (DUF1778 family)
LTLALQAESTNMGAVTPHDESQRRSLINLRVTPRAKDLIDHAAASLGQNRSESMMDASREAADDALMDRQVFRLDAAQFADFVAALDAPPAPNDRLRRLLAIPSPWDK